MSNRRMKSYVAKPPTRRGKRKGSEHVAGRRAPYYTQLLIDAETGLPKRAEGRGMDVRVGAP